MKNEIAEKVLKDYLIFVKERAKKFSQNNENDFTWIGVQYVEDTIKHYIKEQGKLQKS